MSSPVLAPMPLGQILEVALRWGLPAAPVVVAMAMTLGWTPASASFGESYVLYMACMMGVLVGLAPSVLFERWLVAHRLAACVVYAACLEAGWIILTVSYMTGSFAGSLVGGALDGLATAGLFALWLAVGQTGDTRCELAKLAVTSLSGFILYAFVQMLAPLKWPSFLLPVVAAVPMCLRLRDEELPLSCGRGAPGALMTHAGRSTVAAAAGTTAVVAVLFGSCFGVLGFEATGIDSSIVIAGLVLALPIAFPSASEDGVGQIAAPLAITGLCTGLAFGLSVSFSAFLAGCACFMSWMLVAGRRVWGNRSHDCSSNARGATAAPQTLPPASLRLGGLVVGFATLSLMAGLTLSHALITQGSVAVNTLGFAIASLIALADFAWRMVLGRAEEGSPGTDIAFAGACSFLDANGVAIQQRRGIAVTPGAPGTPPAPVQGAAAPDVSLAGPIASDVDALGRACGFSARELEVAHLVCANCGVSYICAKLGLSKSTAKTHIQHIYAKANVHSRDELQLLAEEHGARERDTAGAADPMELHP